MKRGGLDPAVLTERLAAIAGTLSGKEVSGKSIDGLIQAAAVQKQGAGVHGTLPQDADIAVSYHAGAERVSAINQAVTRDTLSTANVGLDNAFKTFRGAMADLVRRKAVDPRGLDPEHPVLGKIVQGEAMSGQAAVERIKEYIFTLPRRINGIEVFGAGLEVSVHRNGKIARVKTYGPSVDSTVASDGLEVPGPNGYYLAQIIDASATDARVHADYPGHRIEAKGVQYFWPTEAGSAVVEPQQVYMVNSVATSDGVTVNGRAFYVAYSMANQIATPRIWPAPNPGAVGDLRK